jgi:D-glycero-D-manno-heptose 1,7-bisphosphate phosphatase
MPGLILTAIARHGIDPRDSILIGDKETDMQAAHAAGVQGYLVG